MMGTISRRVGRLEQSRGRADERRAQIEADAAAFLAKVQALAADMRKDGGVVDPDVAPAARARLNEFWTRFAAEAAHLA